MDKRRVSLVLVFVMIISVIRPYVWYGENASQKKMTAKAATVEVWDGSVDTSWYDREAKSFKISNASQLAGLAQLVNRGETMYGKKITITADIYLNRDWGNYDSWGNLAPDNQWTPIGSYQHAFRGTIDGNNHCVYGIYINMQENVQGLFGRVETNSDYDEQAIKDWHIKNSYIRGASYVGGFVGCAYRVDIAGCSVEDSIVIGEGDRVGGLAGSSYFSCCIERCHVQGKINGENYVGGIVGEILENHGGVQNCYVKGNVSGADYVGGVAGFIKTRYGPHYSYSQGKVSGEKYVGGLIGSFVSDNAISQGCYTVMEVSGLSGTGTIYGQYKKKPSSVQDAVYLKKNSINQGLCDVGCDEFSSEYRWNQLEGSGVSEEYLCGGEFCYNNSEYYGVSLGKDKYPSFVNAKNKVYQASFYDDKSAMFTQRYYNSGDKIDNLQPYITEGKMIRWATYDKSLQKYVVWDFQNDWIAEDISLYPFGITSMKNAKLKKLLGSVHKELKGKDVTKKSRYSEKSNYNRSAELTVKENPVIWDGTEETDFFNTRSEALIGVECKIYTASQLAGINSLLRSQDEEIQQYIKSGYVEFKLMNDIYLNEDWENYLSWDKEPPKNKWTPIGNEKSPFTASFNGNGHTIYGLYIDTKEDAQGLFGEAEYCGYESSIKNLTIKNAYIKGGSRVGAIVGESLEQICVFDCNVLQSVVGCDADGEYAGGIVGYGNQINSIVGVNVNQCKVSGGDTVGGVIGYCNNSSLIEQCSFQGELSGNYTVGGIAATVNTCNKISACYSLGTVFGKQCIGGLIGKTQYVNSWGDASYTACKLEGTNQGGILFGCFPTTDYNCSDVKVYYPKECYEEKGWQDIGCDLNGVGSTKNYFTNAARPREYFTNGKFCNENKDIYGMILMQDEYPQFLNEKNKVLKIQYWNKNDPNTSQQKYCNYKEKLADYQPYKSDNIQVEWYVYANGEYTDVKWNFNEDLVITDTRLGLCRQGEVIKPTPTATPTAIPTAFPDFVTPSTATPTPKLTATPTMKPTATPTLKPTATPTQKPTATPTRKPTATPTITPTQVPIQVITEKPEKTPEQTKIPTVTAAPKQASVVKAGKVFVVKKIRYRVIKVNGRKGSVTVKGVKGTVKKLVIPKKVVYKGIRFDVAAIDDRAFYKNRKIRRALIGTNIQSIGKMAFYGTKQLRYIDIRTKKLKAIGKKAFIGIYPAAKIKIPRTRKKKYIKLLANKYG